MATGTIKTNMGEYVELLPTTQITGTGTKTLNGNANNYKAIVFCVAVNGTTGWRFFTIPKQFLVNSVVLDVSWQGTGNTTWWAYELAKVYGTTLEITHHELRSYTSLYVRIFGVV